MTTTDATTSDGVADTNADFDNIEGAAAALMERWTDAEKPSEGEDGAKKKTPPEKKEPKEAPAAEEDAEDETDQTTDDTTAEDDDDGTDADDDGADEPVATDKHKVTITVDGEERTVSVKDLKRLYGQEASLTRKSQEVAALRKAAEETSAKTGVALKTLQERAAERYKPYADIDYLVAQTQLSAEDFATLRAEARAAYDDHAYLSSELSQHIQKQNEERTTAHREQAKAAVEVLQKDIPQWSQKLYDDIRSFGVKSGLEQADVDNIVDPTIIKLLHNAMLYERGKTVATTKKVAAVKKPIKPSAAASTATAPKDEATLRKLTNSGSREDAAALFLSRWENRDTD